MARYKLTLMGILCLGSALTWQVMGAADETQFLLKPGTDMAKILYIVEALRWPKTDYSDVQAFISQPDPSDSKIFNELVVKILQDDKRPGQLDKIVHYLNGWPAKGRTSFVAQYEKDPYRLRLKKSGLWITVAVERIDGQPCIEKIDEKSVLAFVDEFLSEKVNSKSQDYGNMVDSNKAPSVTLMDSGTLVAYPVQTSKPDIDGVAIWTNGKLVLINLQERVKVILNPTAAQPVTEPSTTGP